MTLPFALHLAVEDALGVTIRDARPLSGGMINQAAYLSTSDGLLFLKWKHNAPLGFFEAEARGLELLRGAEALRVPSVVAWHDAPPLHEGALSHPADEAPPSWLALEWLEGATVHDEDAFARDFAEGLAAQHRVTAAQHGDAKGRGNFLGEFAQDNTPHDSWAEFWRDCRLMPLLERGLRDGLLSPAYRDLLLRVVDHSATLFDQCDTRPALLHGDLWSGNYLPIEDDNGKTLCALVDPAAYFGSREMELAYIELFGGFPQNFMACYHTAYPLNAGYERRRPLLQIYPLLVHYLHFGAEYGPPLERACSAALNWRA